MSQISILASALKREDRGGNDDETESGTVAVGRAARRRSRKRIECATHLRSV